MKNKVSLKKIYLPNTELLSYQITSNKSVIQVIGPLGYSSLELPNTLTKELALKNNYLLLKVSEHIDTNKVWKKLFQEYNSILTKLYYGVCFSFRQYLKVKGLGYFIKYVEGEHKLCLIFGKSNYEYFQIPENIQIILKPRKKKTSLQTIFDKRTNVKPI